MSLHLRVAWIVCPLALLSTANATDIYASGRSGTSLVRIDSGTGSTSLVGDFGFAGSYSTAFTPDGVLWTVTQSGTGSLARVNLATGTATPVGATGLSVSCMALASSPIGQLYAVDFDGKLYSGNKTTGHFDLVATTPVAMAMDLAFDSAGTLWAIETSQTPGAIWTINPVTGASQRISTLSVSGAMGLAIDSSDHFFVTDWVDTPNLYSLDPYTGVATPLGAVGYPRTHGGDFAPVPEPTSLLALAGGMALIARRRRGASGPR
jgi:DNA-binding beta-propeller fold protein YncE